MAVVAVAETLFVETSKKGKEVVVNHGRPLPQKPLLRFWGLGINTIEAQQTRQSNPEFSPCMSHETNPFRLSMLRRSQSPFEDPFEPLATTLQPPMLRNPSASSVQSAASAGSPKNASHIRPASVVLNNPYNVSTGSAAGPSNPPNSAGKSNPFRVDLSDSSSPAESTGLLEPPSYLESEGRRHSDPSLMSRDEKSTDERYREGLEEGIRIAQEQEKKRRRELRERRARHGANREPSSRDPMSHEHGTREHGSREHRSRRMRSKSESAGHHSRRTKHKQGESLDVIDKMDVTGVYGGSGFHHDGPFDACAPHRNKTSRRIVATPISAFPADGPNNSLAVEDPRLLAYRKEESVYGRGGNTDLPPEISQASFDPTERGAKVHGQQTMGLGSTTFIDGTPASRDAIAAGRNRSQSLGRSKSVRDDEPKTLLSRVRSLRVTRH